MSYIFFHYGAFSSPALNNPFQAHKSTGRLRTNSKKHTGLTQAGFLVGWCVLRFELPEFNGSHVSFIRVKFSLLFYIVFVISGGVQYCIQVDSTPERAE